MLAVSTNLGRIRPVVVLGKALGSIVTIGTGGSVGREGPIVQIGSAVGSTVAQILRLSESRTITLLASGAAAGIAATFNAPIAGVMFSTEVIMRRTGLREFSAIVVAAVSGAVVSHRFLGNAPAFQIPVYEMSTQRELLLYLALGVICAPIGVLFIRFLTFSEKLFEGFRSLPDMIKPAIGGLVLGVMLLVFPQLYGGGFGVIEDALNCRIPFLLLACLVFTKIMATSVSLGSGSSGGVFAPSLFIGAMAGGAFGKLAGYAFPEIAGESGSYAMIGMAATFAATARAPVTAILILFEMTRDYNMILPLMGSTVIAMLISQSLNRESIYTSKLVSRGIDLSCLDHHTSLLEIIKVGDAMTPIAECVKVSHRILLRQVERMFVENGLRRTLVFDDTGRLFGILTLKDLYRRKIDLDTKTVGDLCTRSLHTLYLDNSLEDATMIFGRFDVEHIPVMSFEKPGECLGVLKRGGLVKAYSEALTDQAVRTRFIEKMKFEKASGTEIIEYRVGSADYAVGKRIGEIGLPKNCNIVAIRRGPELIAPRGSTVIMPEDLVLALSDDTDALLNALRSTRDGDSNGRAV
jgi:CIC family chloride channel protein